MIRFIEYTLASRWFFWLRIGQFVVALVIFNYAALMPSATVVLHHSNDNFLHFFGNLLLFVSASLAAYGRMKLPMLIVFLAMYSLVIEAAQRFSPGRQVDIHDAVANLLGLIFGFALVCGIEYLWRRLSSTKLA